MQAEINTKVQEAVTEAERLAKMNAEQKAQYEREKKEKEIADREAAITKRELMATAKDGAHVLYLLHGICGLISGFFRRLPAAQTVIHRLLNCFLECFAHSLY